MKKLFPILFILAACTTNSNRVVSQAPTIDEIVKTDEANSWVDQLSFEKKVEKKYLADEDGFTFLLDEKKNILSKESLVNIGTVQLEESLAKIQDPLTKFVAKCYQQKFDEGLKLADEIYQIYKNNTSYWNQVGTCYLLRSDYSKAILFYNKSRDLDAKYSPAVNNLGVIYFRQGKFSKALLAFKKASDLGKFSVTPNYNLAQLFLKFGNAAKAISILQGLQKRSPQDQDVVAALATANLLNGDYPQAIIGFSTLDKSIIQRPNVGLNYCVALKLLNRKSESLAIFSNMAPASSGPLLDYYQKVEKFIRN